MKARILLAAVAPLTLASLALVGFPLWVIRPFRYQNPHALMMAMQARTWAPLATVLLLAAILGCLVFLRPWAGAGRHWLRRGVLGSIAGFALLAAVGARVNVFEWMFHPDRDAAFVSARQARLDDSTMLMTVHVGSQDRAYPITVMAYHHILNDWIGETPVAATY